MTEYCKCITSDLHGDHSHNKSRHQLRKTSHHRQKTVSTSLHHIAERWGVAPSEITLVGDSLFDAGCAENAGTGLVLVGWGYAADPAALRAWPAPVCETVSALETALLEG